MDYSDANVLGRIMTKIVDLRLRYYVDTDGIVRTFWRGSWEPYHEVAKIDKRMVI